MRGDESQLKEVLPGCSDWDDSKVVQENNKRKGNVREFKMPETENLISDFSRKKFAPQAQHKIRLAVGLYEACCKNRIEKTSAGPEIIWADLSKLLQFNKGDLCYYRSNVLA